MSDKKINTFTMDYCTGCSRFCWMGYTTDKHTKIYRPSLGYTTIRSIKINNKTIFPIYADSQHALEMTHKIAEHCKHNLKKPITSLSNYLQKHK